MVVTFAGWPGIRPLTSRRLRLEPLRCGHAEDMAPLLDDPELHTFIGGRPATEEELRARYARQVQGRSPDGSQLWLNWIVRRIDTEQAVGTVQATISGSEGGGLTAETAWLIGTPQQRQGFAAEAAAAMTAWLRDRGVETAIAHVHPHHAASMSVARALGLVPTETMVDGEVRWQSPAGWTVS